MTRRRDLERHRDSLGDIGEILSSMKTLAYMETRKLSRFLSAQQQVVESIETAAADFLGFHPELLTEARGGRQVVLLVGSERGFCGDFNRALVQTLESRREASDAEPPTLIVVGHKLDTLLERHPDLASSLEGASVAEDVSGVLQRSIEAVDALQAGSDGLDLVGIHHGPDGIVVRPLLPPFDRRRASQPHTSPPRLNVSPEALFLDLTEHYLLAALNEMLYTSLMVENDRRVTHLERAVRHLEEESRELTRKCRSLRQEEIIEEIEVILLSASSLNEPGADRMR